MLMEPSTTWLLVRTSPVESRIRPLPAACSLALAVWMVVLTSTTAGLTFAAGEPALGPLVVEPGVRGPAPDRLSRFSAPPGLLRLRRHPSGGRRSRPG